MVGLGAAAITIGVALGIAKDRQRTRTEHAERGLRQAIKAATPSWAEQARVRWCKKEGTEAAYWIMRCTLKGDGCTRTFLVGLDRASSAVRLLRQPARALTDPCSYRSD